MNNKRLASPAVVAVLLERLARISTNDSGRDELNPVQWEALRFFAKANRFSCTPGGLTAYLGVTKGTVSQTINALEKHGLIEKQSIVGDKRQVQVCLTDKGRQSLGSDPQSVLLDDLKSLSDKDVRDLEKSLRKLVNHALDRRKRAPFGVCSTCQHFRAKVPDGDPHFCALLQVPLSDKDSSLICREQS